MKKMTIFVGVIILFIQVACHDIKVGYLKTENALYNPDTTIIRKEPDPVKDALRIQNEAPWRTLAFQGYLGTPPILFAIESVTSQNGQEAADLFKKDLSIIGGGSMLYKLRGEAPRGRYLISIRVSNEGYSKVIPDAFTFIVE